VARTPLPKPPEKLCYEQIAIVSEHEVTVKTRVIDCGGRFRGRDAPFEGYARLR